MVALVFETAGARVSAFLATPLFKPICNRRRNSMFCNTTA